MAEDQDVPDEEEQVAIAIEWFIAMWDEALKRGVSDATMGIIALSATVNKLTEVYDKDSVVAMLERTLGNVQAGQFDVEKNGDAKVN